MRYNTNLPNAAGWWLHDLLVHPLTGAIGFAGRLLGSLRLMALAHHIHNVTAPTNDVIADYVEAAARAGRNETRSNPGGSMTPDEREWALIQAQRLTGRTDYIPDDVVLDVLERAGVRPWNQQSDRTPPPDVAAALPKCKQCNFPYGPRDRFCSQCGGAVEQPEQPRSQSTPKAKAGEIARDERTK